MQTNLTGRTSWSAPFYLSALLLTLTFVTGGGSYDRGWGDVLCELLALPVLGLTVMAWARARRTTLWWLASAALVGLCLLLVSYQLALPQGAIEAAVGRADLGNDLRSVGVVVPSTWSLTPLASERGAWSILPALALFFATFACSPAGQRGLVQLLVALTTASMILGFLQIGAQQDSPFNLFPEWSTIYGGFFASFNHQATALALGALCAVALSLDGAPERQGHRAATAARGTWLMIAAAMVLSIPLTTSRAVMVLALGAIVALAVVCLLRKASQGNRGRIVGLVAGLMTAGGFLGVIAWQWLQVDRIEELRTDVAAATLEAAWPLSPMGGGLGAFVPWFQQEMPLELRASYYFNHAHNEYAQWWLEGGLPAMAVLLLALSAIGLAGARVLHQQVASGDSPRQSLLGPGALIALLLVLAHGVVDYPLRTQALMVVSAMLAAVLMSGGSKRTSIRNESGHRIQDFSQ